MKLRLIVFLITLLCAPVLFAMELQMPGQRPNLAELHQTLCDSHSRNNDYLQALNLYKSDEGKSKSITLLEDLSRDQLPHPLAQYDLGMNSLKEENSSTAKYYFGCSQYPLSKHEYAKLLFSDNKKSEALRALMDAAGPWPYHWGHGQKEYYHLPAVKELAEKFSAESGKTDEALHYTNLAAQLTQDAKWFTRMGDLYRRVSLQPMAYLCLGAAAEKGCNTAKITMAEMCYFAEGVQPNKEDAVDQLRSVIISDDPGSKLAKPNAFALLQKIILHEFGGQAANLFESVHEKLPSDNRQAIRINRFLGDLYQINGSHHKAFKVYQDTLKNVFLLSEQEQREETDRVFFGLRALGYQGSKDAAEFCSKLGDEIPRLGMILEQDLEYEIQKGHLLQALTKLQQEDVAGGLDHLRYALSGNGWVLQNPELKTLVMQNIAA